MDQKRLRELIELVISMGLTELEVDEGGSRIKIRREPAPAQPAASSARTPQALAPPAAAQAEQAEALHGMATVRAPIVGTFYRSPSPESEAYVEKGSTVKRGQVVCLIEAMKLMNEIESEADGRITEVLVESGSSVEYGQPLFLIEPDSV